MKLSLVFCTLASIVVLATAYPVVERSNVEKREELNSDVFVSHGSKRDGEKREAQVEWK
ncbi:hypothetical protein P692DRAFT_201788901 [Suillus brevipes Sb2]|nr:hypothetical protein P692DRAFT_201788901 [Suillus brevipes Sb2]